MFYCTYYYVQFREINDFEIIFSNYLRSADVMWGTSEDFRKAVVQNLLACTGSAVLSNCLPTARNVFLEFAIKLHFLTFLEYFSLSFVIVWNHICFSKKSSGRSGSLVNFSMSWLCKSKRL